MAGINHVVLVGNLTRDAEMKVTNTGLVIVKLSLAVNRRVKKGDAWQDEANFFDAVYMGKAAEAVHQYLSKGKQVGIQGELRQDRWEQEGQKRSRVEIFVTNLQLLGGGRGGQAPAAAEPAAGEAPQAGTASPGGPSPDDFNDDIPF